MTKTNDIYEANKAHDFETAKAVEEELDGLITRIGKLADEHNLSCANIICTGARTQLLDKDNHERGFKVITGMRCTEGMPPEVEACALIAKLGLQAAMPMVAIIAMKMQMMGGTEQLVDMNEYEAMRESINTLPA